VGRWSTTIPAFIGLWMKPSPAKVKTGEAVSQPVPCHSGSWLGTRATWLWRTATPLGRPVVPEVYMMSARSSPSNGAWIRVSSSDFTASRSTAPLKPGPPTVATRVSDGSEPISGPTESA